MEGFRTDCDQILVRMRGSLPGLGVCVVQKHGQVLSDSGAMPRLSGTSLLRSSNECAPDCHQVLSDRKQESSLCERPEPTPPAQIAPQSIRERAT